MLLTLLAANFYLSLVKFWLYIVTSKVYNLISLILSFPKKSQRHYLPYCLKQINNSESFVSKFEMFSMQVRRDAFWSKLNAHFYIGLIVSRYVGFGLNNKYLILEILQTISPLYSCWNSFQCYKLTNQKQKMCVESIFSL